MRQIQDLPSDTQAICTACTMGNARSTQRKGNLQLEWLYTRKGCPNWFGVSICGDVQSSAGQGPEHPALLWHLPYSETSRDPFQPKSFYMTFVTQFPLPIRINYLIKWQHRPVASEYWMSFKGWHQPKRECVGCTAKLSHNFISW